MSLKSIAKCPAPTCSPTDKVSDAVDLMLENHFGAVVVVDGGKVIGIYTERDVLDLIRNHRDPDTTRLREVMASPVEMTHVDTKMERALGLMRSRNFHYLPLLNDANEPVGILSIRQIFSHYVNDLHQVCAAMASYIGADGPGG